MPTRQQYNNYKERRICTHCCVPLKETDTLRCSRCVDNSKERYYKIKNSGFCTAHPTIKVFGGSTTRCEKCIIMTKLLDAIRYRKLRSSKMCTVHTSMPAVERQSKCSKCLVYLKKYSKSKYLYMKTYVIKQLGGVCRCCGEDNINFLTIAHINNDGSKDRKHNYYTPIVVRKLYKMIVANKALPPKYGIECWNCNSGKGNYNNICPHKSPILIQMLNGKNSKSHKKAILKYGGVCVGCGETELGFLTIEHTKGGGRKEIRDRFDGCNYTFYKHLRDNPIRDDITVLCWNCNCSKGKNT